MITSALIVQGASQVAEGQTVSGLSPQPQAGGGDFGAAFSQSLAASGASSTASAPAKPEIPATASPGIEGSEKQSGKSKGSAAPGTDVESKTKPATASHTVVTGQGTSGQSQRQTALHSSRVAALEDVLSTSVTGSKALTEESVATGAASSSKSLIVPTAVAPASAAWNAVSAKATAGAKLEAKELSGSNIELASLQGEPPALSPESSTKAGEVSVGKSEAVAPKAKVDNHSSAGLSNGSAKKAATADTASLAPLLNPAVSQLPSAHTSTTAIASTNLEVQPLAALPAAPAALQGVNTGVGLKSGGSIQDGLSGSGGDLRSSVPARTQGISVASLNGGQAGNLASTLSAESSASSTASDTATSRATSLPDALNLSQVKEVSHPQESVSAAGQRLDGAANAGSFGSDALAQGEVSSAISSKEDQAPSVSTVAQFKALPSIAEPQRASTQAAAGSIASKAAEAVTGLSSTTAARSAHQNGAQAQGQLPVAPGTTEDTASDAPSFTAPAGATAVPQEQVPSTTLTIPSVAPLAAIGTATRTAQTSKLNAGRQSAAAPGPVASSTGTGGASAASHGETAVTPPSSAHDGLSVGSGSAPTLANAAVVADGVPPSGAPAPSLAVAPSAPQHLAVASASPALDADARSVAAAGTSLAAEITGATHPSSSLASGVTTQPLSATSTTLEVGVHGGGTQGWLRIRAEMDGQGEVTASLAASSPRAEEVLKGQMPALNAYLHSEQMSVTTTLAERSLLSAAAGGHNTSLTSLGSETTSGGHNGSAFQGGSNSQGLDGRSLDGQAQSERRDAWEPASSTGGVVPASGMTRQPGGVDGVGNNLQVTSLDGSGRWLNVTA